MIKSVTLAALIALFASQEAPIPIKTDIRIAFDVPAYLVDTNSAIRGDFFLYIDAAQVSTNNSPFRVEIGQTLSVNGIPYQTMSVLVPGFATEGVRFIRIGARHRSHNPDVAICGPMPSPAPTTFPPYYYDCTTIAISEPLAVPIGTTTEPVPPVPQKTQPRPGAFINLRIIR